MGSLLRPPELLKAREDFVAGRITADYLRAAEDGASRYIPFEQLCLSAQYGFSPTGEGNTLTREEQTAKLRLTVETAREVWG